MNSLSAAQKEKAERIFIQLISPQDWVWSVVFSPDGKTIAGASNDGTVKLWNWDFEDLVEKGCERFGEHLANNPEKLEQLEVCQN